MNKSHSKGFKKVINWFIRKPLPAKLGEINYHAFDRFTLVHFSVGVLSACLGLGGWFVLACAILWEFLENPLKVQFPFVFPHASRDTIQNAAADVIAITLGWYLYTFFIK